jgi:hypothetical protein
VKKPIEARRYDRKGASQYLYERWGIEAAPKTLANLSSDGKGPVYSRVGNGRVTYLQTDLDAWAESRISPPASSPTEERARGVKLPTGAVENDAA